MNKKTILIIIFITSTALAGILPTQIYWVGTAFKFKEEQFDNSVRMALKSVINQFLQNKTDTVFQKKLIALSCRKQKLSIDDYIDNLILDSIVKNELKCMEINTVYRYGIYSKYNNRFVLGDYKDVERELLDTHYQFSLASIYKPGDYYLSILFTNKTHILLHRMELWVFLSILFLLILIISFIFVIFTILHQKKISEIKTDFINNMTHEFKTPIATSSLAAEMIQKEEVMANRNKLMKYSSIILDENNRLQSQVEQVLQVAILESGKHQYKIRRLNTNEIIKDVVNSFELRIKEENIKLELQLDATNPFFMGDKAHILNIYYNLIDNAIKYSPNNPTIFVYTYNVGGNIVISFKDNGIGISKEYQNNVFKNLFRVPTGNIHEVRGFGLGLYYVKTIVDQFGGRIELVSELGDGSNFKLFFPTNQTKN
ncbi:MAG: HAMP domain-containing histidine kinase [Bacteroidetes bacterium]|nr:HAMP domain-containing histidine kinase [Bacteroidota bacterium]